MATNEERAIILFSAPHRKARDTKKEIYNEARASGEEFFFGSLARHWAQEGPVIPPPTQSTQHSQVDTVTANQQILWRS